MKFQILLMSCVFFFVAQASQKESAPTPADTTTINMNCFDELRDLPREEIEGEFSIIAQTEAGHNATLATLTEAHDEPERQRLTAIIKSCQGHRASLKEYLKIRFPEKNNDKKKS